MLLGLLGSPRIATILLITEVAKLFYFFLKKKKKLHHVYVELLLA